MEPPASDTGGVKPMKIAGRLVRERERLLGMTDEERAFRKQWLKDQILQPNEPKEVPELYTELYNPIRRFYRAPLDAFGRALVPVLGHSAACKIRFFTGKFLMLAVGAFYAAYYFKYNANDWTRVSGWKVKQSRKSVLPGDECYPAVSEKTTGSDYWTMGFDQVNTEKM